MSCDIHPVLSIKKSHILQKCENHMKTIWKTCEMDIPQKFRLTFRQRNYFRNFTHGFGVVVRDLGEWRPGFYSEFRCASREHSRLPWGAIFRKVLVLTQNPRFTCSFSRNKFPKWILPQTLQSERSMETYKNTNTYTYAYTYAYVYVYHICICICLCVCFSISGSTGP